MISDQKYRSKLAFRARGQRDLERLVGGVFAEVDAFLEQREPVRILELGCGYGTALLELRARYGARVELHGLNRERNDGDVDILRRHATERALLGQAASDIGSLPALHYADVAHGLPFEDAAFDLVYSQVAWLYFGNKVAVLQEIIRVLAEDGIAKIDADDLRPGLPPEYRRLVEIWNAGRLLPFGEYARRFGMAFVPAPEGQYLRFGKCRRFGEDLELVLEIDVNRLYAHWDGIKCIYRVTTG